MASGQDPSCCRGEGGLAEREDWNRKVGKEKFREHVKHWHFDWLDVPQLVEQTGEIFEFPLLDREAELHFVYRKNAGRNET